LYLGVTEPGYDCDKDDAEDDGAFHVSDHGVDDDEEADNSKPECGISHLVSHAHDCSRGCSSWTQRRRANRLVSHHLKLNKEHEHQSQQSLIAKHISPREPKLHQSSERTCT